MSHGAPFDPIAWWSQHDGERTAVIDAVSGARHSYASLDAHAHACAALLVQRGVRAGDRVAIVAHNRYEFVPLLFACIRVGAICVPLNWRLSAVELARVLYDASPVLIFGEDGFRGAIVYAASAANWIDLDDELPLLLEPPVLASGATNDDRLAVQDEETIAMLLYTSGSTGIPKGVMVTHRQMRANAVDTVSAWALTADDRGTVATPFFHTSGWHVFATPLWYCGGAVVLMGAFDAPKFLGRLAEHCVSLTFVVPTQLEMLRESPEWGRPLPALRTFISGGAPCHPATQRAVRSAGYRVRDAYGLTECGPNCFAFTDAEAQERPDHVGWPMPSLEARLRTADDMPAPPGAVGELQLRGPQLFAGYFNARALTDELLTANGWLRTGDLASVDDDGAYRIRGRLRDMFISGGENVYPGEVEAALLECPGVVAAAVVGVSDRTWGEVGGAMVVAHPTHRHADALLQALRARLAGYKLPRHLLFVERIPTLANGKVDRVAVHRELAQRDAIPMPPLARDAHDGDH